MPRMNPRTFGRPESTVAVVFGCLSVFLWTLAGSAAAQTNACQIKSFGFPLLSTGANPGSRLLRGADGALYGTAMLGGSADAGTVFRLEPNAAGLTILHRFGGEGDGATPVGGLILAADGALYGTTLAGGLSNAGAVFRLNRDGSGYRLLRSFGLLINDGTAPQAELVQGSDGALYGTTSAGGASGGGTVFKLGMNGTDYQVLHSFDGGTDGGGPLAGLVLAADGLLYGVTSSGGASNGGTLFRLSQDGSGYQRLRNFGDVPGDGFGPQATLAGDQSGALYGTTVAGGLQQAGVVFRFDPAASAYSVLYSFGAFDGDGIQPVGGLIQGVDGALYGTTVSGGGEDSSGSIFRLSANGSDYAQLYLFSAEEGDAGDPRAAFVQGADGALYASSSAGGAYGDGTLFRINTDGTDETILFHFSRGGGDGKAPTDLLLGSDGRLYGTTSGGGAVGAGTVFSLSTNGLAYTILHSFTDRDGGGDGAVPLAGLVQTRDGVLFGTTSKGGTEDYGTIFRIGADGGNYAVVRSFSGANGGAVNPCATLIQGVDGELYGTTLDGGGGGAGAVFTIHTDGTGYAVLHDFLGDDGAGPNGVIQGRDGALYGTALFGGADGRGAIFRLATNGSGFSLLHDFAGGTNDGSNPQASLAQGLDGTLYGTTLNGGTTGLGTVFKLNPDGSGYSGLHSFDGLPGRGQNPQAPVLPGGEGSLYGTTFSDDTHPGTVFKLGTNGEGYSVLHVFTGDAGEEASPQAGLVMSADGTVFGTTSGGGDLNQGTVFKLFSTCSYSLSLPGATVGADGASGSFVVHASLGCPWNAVSANAWLHTASTGNGDGTVDYTVEANPDGRARLGTLLVGGQTFTVTQAVRTCRIATSPQPPSGGVTTGDGVFPAGTARSVTASPASGYQFVNWTENGVAVSTAATYTSVLLGDRQLVANFAPKPFVPVPASYHGLFSEPGAVTASSAGAVTVTLTRQGRFSGQLHLGNATRGFTGQFGTNRVAQARLTRPGLSPLQINLQMVVSDDNDEIAGMVSDGSWNAQIAMNRAWFSAHTNPAPQAGRYTLILRGTPDSGRQPAGDGCFAVAVSAGGAVALRGSLADGRPTSQAAWLSRTGRWPLYRPLNNGQGLVWGWIAFTNGPAEDLSGSATWTKPPDADGDNYARGFNLETAISGSKYQPPSRGGQPIGSASGQLVLSGAGLQSPTTNQVALAAAGRVLPHGGDAGVVRIESASGLFHGGIALPGRTLPVVFRGVVLQRQNLGTGYFLDDRQSGQVRLAPAQPGGL
jgi:uncharacterized repeat protein (TIGR03803 family)